MEQPWVNQKLAGRILELDGVRGLAILLVLILHFLVELLGTTQIDWQAKIALLFRLSWSGVDLFFVLSGFLIGGILLDNKYAGDYYRTFYLRRFYRIVPLYAVLIITFALGILLVGPNTAKPLTHMFNWRIVPLWVYPLFLQNIFMTLHHSYGSGWMGVTWSLAVEEQFYLLLPFVVRRLGHKGIVWFAVSMVIVAPVLRTLMGYYGADGLGAYILLPCRADALGCGLLVAIACRNQIVWTWLVSHRRYVYAAFAILGFGILAWIVNDAPLGYTWIAAFYTSLLLLVVTPGWGRLVFHNFVLVRLGVLAYALYLFHPGILQLFHYVFFRTFPSIQDVPTLCVTLLALGTVMLLAQLSWLVFEKPLIKYAHGKFHYSKTS